MALAVRSTPYTTHGWRPTSAVYQPASVAMNGSGKLRKMKRSSQRLFSIRCLMISQEPSHASPSMIRPQPTMTRKVMNGMRTGGRSCGGKDVSPTSFDVVLMLPMMLPSTGILSS